ncbi:hypothetical protein HJG60_009622 [Phyllostomus discolor]|uniref:Uncharacterized protein n=1 Tax=Phyllostomus discolor TaxID=89673 RepID=A0A833YI56_9CHIR|nr:hypothetical protein HJG60_009622 [Phyllostomus discolor]
MRREVCGGGEGAQPGSSLWWHPGMMQPGQRLGHGCPWWCPPLPALPADPCASRQPRPRHKPKTKVTPRVRVTARPPPPPPQPGGMWEHHLQGRGGEAGGLAGLLCTFYCHWDLQAGLWSQQARLPECGGWGGGQQSVESDPGLSPHPSAP